MAEENEAYQVPDPMTEPCSRYFWEQHQLIHFFQLVILDYQTITEVNSVLSRITLSILTTLLQELKKENIEIDINNEVEIEEIINLSKRLSIENKVNELIFNRKTDEIKIILSHNLSDVITSTENSINSLGPALRKKIFSYKDLLCQMILCRGFDNFLSYITEMLVLIFQIKPEALSSSSEKIDFATILKYKNNMNGLIFHIIEKRVNDLSYSNISDINKYFNEKHGFDIVREEYINDITKISKIRNIIVHNRAIINDRFLRDFPYTLMKSGDRLKLEFKEVLEYLNLLGRSVCDIDTRAAEKFGLPQPITKTISNPWASIQSKTMQDDNATRHSV